jgi:hypothetical protein
MIGIAHVITHGSNLLRYITGESPNKEHPEKIEHVEDRFLPEDLDSSGIWQMFKLRCPLAKNAIRIEISPAENYTRNFTIDDWRQLWHDFMAEYDKQELSKNGKVYSKRTNIAGSMSTCWGHFDSASGVPHMHAAVCRYDENGEDNNEHQIKIRVQRAAEAVARNRGWKTAMERHDEIIKQANDACMQILKSMPKWDWDTYQSRLSSYGWNVNVMRDKSGVIHGYSIKRGNTKYKASELGTGRNLMYSKLEATWRMLHPVVVRQPVQPAIEKPQMIQPKVEHSEENRNANRLELYTKWRPGTESKDFKHDDKQYKLFLPNGATRALDDVINPREIANWDDIQHFAIAVFVGLIAANDAQVASCGGGGSSNNEGWRNEKDDDELRWLYRCAHYAKSKFKINPKRGIKR